jgi:hypothetical protein
LDDGLEKNLPQTFQFARSGTIERSRRLPFGAQVWIGPKRYGKFNLLRSAMGT